MIKRHLLNTSLLNHTPDWTWVDNGGKVCFCMLCLCFLITNICSSQALAGQLFIERGLQGLFCAEAKLISGRSSCVPITKFKVGSIQKDRLGGPS